LLPRRLAFVLIFLGACSPMENATVNSTPVTSILARIEAGEGFSTRDVLEFQSQPNLLNELIDSLQTRPPQNKLAAVRLLIEMGRPVLKAEGELPDRPAPYINDPKAVAYLANSLNDNESDVRNLASKTLVWEVPEILVRNHSKELIESIRHRPTIDEAALLLGLTSNETARTMINTNKELHDVDPEATRMAFARLGDWKAENAVIDAYIQAKEPREKADYARKLGYIGTVRSVLTLARDIRTPETYVWKMNSRRSMRLHVIEGLHQAFLNEPVFWRPFFKPENDLYYETIERWLTRNLGVTSDRPRPEFLYEEDAPIIPGQGH